MYLALVNETKMILFVVLQVGKERSPSVQGDSITSLPISIPLSTVHPSKLPVSIPLASVVLPSRAERLVRFLLTIPTLQYLDISGQRLVWIIVHFQIVNTCVMNKKVHLKLLLFIISLNICFCLLSFQRNTPSPVSQSGQTNGKDDSIINQNFCC